MRLIDADALIDEIKNHLWDWETVNGITAQTVLKQTITDVENQPTASPWHRVEEPPKEHGKYPVCWIENGNFYWQEAHYCYYQDGDKWVAWSSYQGDDVEITPDYWMPIEPPTGTERSET